MSDVNNEVCKKCGSENIVMVEYTMDSPEYYDGISEIVCNDCNVRFGRWSGKELKEGEIENKYGMVQFWGIITVEIDMDPFHAAPVTIDPEVFKTIKKTAEASYAGFGKIRCPYLQEDVSFNAKGMEHLKFKQKNHARSQADQFMRFKLLGHAPEIIKLSRTLQGIKRTKLFEPHRSSQRSEFLLVEVIFYEFIAVIDERLRIRVVVKRAGEAPPYFWSVIPFWKAFSENGDRTMYYGDPVND